ncbi:heme transporter hrg1-B-like isoform X2 [Saccostrea echinata]|uniref:heme transporter hrg1-B-like isoform X2 n=1 Tax=Saccostrea echinata TaxID=191078 RepID=UPI002A82F8B8|nr:heme transporter hrg1-B-like isoform X2 [Saccostrea echinata]
MNPPRPPSPCWMKARITFAVIGLLVGVSVLFVFGVNFHNWNVALWGLLSGIAAGLSLFIHIAYIKRYWETNPYPLKKWMLSGCFIQLAGVCGFVTYLTLAIVNKQGLIIEGPGYYLTCVWCFMTWKWGFYVFYFSRSYKRLYLSESDYKPQIDEN